MHRIDQTQVGVDQSFLRNENDSLSCQGYAIALKLWIIHACSLQKWTCITYQIKEFLSIIIKNLLKLRYNRIQAITVPCRQHKDSVVNLTLFINTS